MTRINVGNIRHPDASTDSISLDSSARVGIGTSSPSYLLDISGSSPDIQLDDTDASGEAYRIQSTNGALRIVNTGVAERARLDSSGRLLVGATASRSLSNHANIQTETTSSYCISAVQNSNDDNGSIISFGKTRGTAVGGTTAVSSGDSLGILRYYGSDGTNMVRGAEISCLVDGTPGTNDMPGRLVFSTTADGSSSPTERMRITQGGAVKFTTNGTYEGSSYPLLNEFNQHNNGYNILELYHQGTNPFGIYLDFDGASPDDNSNYYLRFDDSTTTRFRVYSDGDVQNHDNSYGSTSDERLKQDIVDAGSQWDDIKGLRVRKFRFIKDVENHGENAKTLLGLVAQEAETVSPGLVLDNPDLDPQGNDLGTSTKSIKYSILYMKAVKALQEAMERIETLEAKVSALEGG